LNGEVVHLGKKLEVAVPFNAGVVGLVHQVEQTAEFISIDALRQALDVRVL
jgi:ketopantoate reductase